MSPDAYGTERNAVEPVAKQVAVLIGVRVADFLKGSSGDEGLVCVVARPHIEHSNPEARFHERICRVDSARARAHHQDIDARRLTAVTHGGLGAAFQ